MSGADETTRFNYYLRLLADYRETVRMLDERASTIVNIDGILIAIILTAYSYITEFGKKALPEETLYYILIIISVCCLIVSMALAALVVLPKRLPRPDFKDISEGLERLKKFFKIIESQISRKSYRISWSYAFFFVSVCFMAVLVIHVLALGFI